MAREVVANTAVTTITLPVIEKLESCVICEIKTSGAMAAHVAKLNNDNAKVLDGVVVTDWPWDTSDATETYCAAYKFA